MTQSYQISQSSTGNPPRILCVWELGGELGHIARLAAIARALAARGYVVWVALKDVSRARDFFAGANVRLVQAPVWLPKVTMQRPTACLADVLLLQGYLEEWSLHSLVEAWHNLFELVQPDLVVADYAPTALLALRDKPVRRVLVGTGFAEPVPGLPLRDWRPYKTKDGLIERQEKRLLGVVNSVLQQRQQTLLAHFADLFAADRLVLSNFRVLDHHSDTRDDALYCLGTYASQQNFASAPVAKGTRPRVVVYLKPGYSQRQLLLEALAQCGAQVFVVCPLGRAEWFEPFANARFSYSLSLVNLPAALAEAQLFVGHGNSGTVRESLLTGTPVLVLPIHLEQLLNGQRLQQLGLGRLMEKIESASGLAQLIAQMLASNTYPQAIQRLLADANESRRPISDEVADECDRLLPRKSFPAQAD